MSIKCLGCGICAQVCPDGIKMSFNTPMVYNKKADCLKEAAKLCPKHLIKVD